MSTGREEDEDEAELSSKAVRQSWIEHEHDFTDARKGILNRFLILSLRVETKTRWQDDQSVPRFRAAKMSNVVHPKLDQEVVEDFEEDDEDDPITALPYRVKYIIFPFYRIMTT